MPARREPRADLENRVKQLERELVNAKRELARHESAAVRPSGPAPRPRTPLRDTVLDLLADVGVAAYSRELMLLLRARNGREVPASRFGPLASDEAATVEKGRPRPVYLCHGLTAERGEAIKRLWARSDWPLAERVVAPTSGRVQHLRMTISLCRLADEHERVVDAEMMYQLAIGHVIDLPGMKVRRDDVDLAAWRLRAEDLLAELLPEDEERRMLAAGELERRLTPAELLFGAQERLLFPLPNAERRTAR